jgi:Fe-S cluster assembly protein SufD
MTALAFRRDSQPDIFQEDFARNRGNLPGVGLGWLEARRRLAMDAFAATGIPTRRVEAWKYTDLANALESELEPAAPFSGVVAEENEFSALDANLLLVNGFL